MTLADHITAEWQAGWICPACGHLSHRMDVWGITCQNMKCDVRAFNDGEVKMRILPCSSMAERALYKGLADGSTPSTATNKYARYYRRHRDEILRRSRLRRKTNPMPSRAASKKWKAKNRAAVADYNHAYAIAKPEIMRAKSARWRRLNPEKWREIQRKVKAAMVASAAPSYVRDLLNKKTPMRQKWPTDFIALKQAELKLKRLCQKSRTTTN